jgi:ubiquinone/menaquinone biosynthesis C-methylase UbiE
VTGAAIPEQASSADPAQADCSREHERIRAAYRFYDSSEQEQRKRDAANRGVRLNAETRWAMLEQALLALELPYGMGLLDVGCGAGDDLQRIAGRFADLHPSLHGADLLPDRIAKARQAVPRATFHVGGAERLPFSDQQFDVVIAATVFSSILDGSLARAVADEMTRLVADSGVIICYDMRYPNPWNPHIKAVGARKLRRLFPAASIRLTPVTLLPPLARRLGALTGIAYRPLHGLPCLRSHYLATIRAVTPRSVSSG